MAGKRNPPHTFKTGTGDLGDDSGNFNCKVTHAQSSVSGSGANLLLNLNVTFQPWFIGKQYSFMAVSDDISHAQPVQIGTWTAYDANATLPLPIVPSGVSTGGIVTTTYQETDHNQFGYVPAMFAEFGQSFDSPASGKLPDSLSAPHGRSEHTVKPFGFGWNNYVDQGVVGVAGVPLESPGPSKIELQVGQSPATTCA